MRLSPGGAPPQCSGHLVRPSCWRLACASSPRSVRLSGHPSGPPYGPSRRADHGQLRLIARCNAPRSLRAPLPQLALLGHGFCPSPHRHPESPQANDRRAAPRHAHSSPRSGALVARVGIRGPPAQCSSLRLPIIVVALPQRSAFGPRTSHTTRWTTPWAFSRVGSTAPCDALHRLSAAVGFAFGPSGTETHRLAPSRSFLRGRRQLDRSSSGS